MTSRHHNLALLCCLLLVCLIPCQAWTTLSLVRHSGNRIRTARKTCFRQNHQQLQPNLSTLLSGRNPITRSSSVALKLGMLDVEDSPFLVPTLLVVAIGLFVAAQGWINSLLSGDRGLGAFLSDGSGFSKSGFKPVKDKEEVGDPLPWLQLPKLDFVEVAGQARESEEVVLQRFESLRLEMNDLLEKGQIKEADAVRQRLERLMSDNGVAYEFSDDDSKK